MITLSETAFYPTSGGQPHDTGTIAGTKVVDVFEREDDIVHVIDGEVEQSEEVVGLVDWSRRHDHMQQHSGQHLLSQALVQVCEIPTVGFTIGPDWSTIVLDRKPDDESIRKALELTNSVINDDRPVQVLFPAPDELAQMPIRGTLTERERIRVVRVEGFDWSPCGGTHCKSTCDVRLLLVLGVRKEKDSYRLEFVCGRRAERIALENAAAVSQVAALLDVGAREIAERTRTLLLKCRDLEDGLDRLREQRSREDRDRLLSEAMQYDDGVVSAYLEDRSVKELRLLARSLVQEPGIVALLVGKESGKVGIVFARSAERDEDMQAVLRTVCSELNCRGGGNAAFASGGGGDDVDVESVLEMARRTVGDWASEE